MQSLWGLGNADVVRATAASLPHYHGMGPVNLIEQVKDVEGTIPRSDKVEHYGLVDRDAQ